MNQGVHTIDLLVATMGRPVEVIAYTGDPGPRADRGRGCGRRRGEVRPAGRWVCYTRRTAAYPGYERPAAGARRPGVGGDRQRRAELHPRHHAKTATGGEGVRVEVGTSVNQVENYPQASGVGAQTAGSDPGRLAVDGHRRQYENFLATLAGKEELRVDLETNRQSIAVITAVYESARTGRSVTLR